MLFHSWGAELVGGHSLAVRDGWMGVDLFFVLSGYLICGQLLDGGANGERQSAQTFYVRRALRILPIYSLVVAAYFLFPGIREAPTIQPAWQFWTFTENLFFAPSLSSAFSHVWSLCVEEHFYLLAPLILGLLLQQSARKHAPAMLAFLILGGMA
jgi:peptidoglycan/LPS O-acetylase OafA/YrhL